MIITLEVNEKDSYIQLNVYDESPYISSVIAKNAEEILQKSIIDYKIKNIKSLYEDFTSNQLLNLKNLYLLQDSLTNFKDSNREIIESDTFFESIK